MNWNTAGAHSPQSAMAAANWNLDPYGYTHMMSGWPFGQAVSAQQPQQQQYLAQSPSPVLQYGGSGGHPHQMNGYSLQQHQQPQHQQLKVEEGGASEQALAA